jgi:hypothetical protein
LNEGQHLLNDSQQTPPAFAKAFPRHPALDALVQAFSRGDYALVRQAGAKLASEATDPEVREAARVLVERTSPDALTRTLLVLSAALLVALSGWWIAHGKAPPGTVPHVEHVR